MKYTLAFHAEGKKGKGALWSQGTHNSNKEDFQSSTNSTSKGKLLAAKKLYPLPAVLMTNNEYMANISSIVPGGSKQIIGWWLVGLRPWGSSPLGLSC